MSKTRSFPMAMKDFFGYRPGEGLREFSAELKALTDKDRQDFTTMLEAEGYTVTAVKHVAA